MKLSELRIIRPATEADLAAAPRPGRVSVWDELAVSIGDEWVVIFEGAQADAKKGASRSRKTAERRGIELRQSRGLVLARKAPEPMGQADQLCKPRAIDKVPTIVSAPPEESKVSAQMVSSKWMRPEGVPPVPWSELRQKDRERCAAAVHRITGMRERADALAALQVSQADIAATIKELRTRGLL